MQPPSLETRIERTNIRESPTPGLDTSAANQAMIPRLKAGEKSMDTYHTNSVGVMNDGTMQSKTTIVLNPSRR